MNELNLNKMQEQILINSELAQYKTNHILHLILTIITAGFWSFFWILSAATTIQNQNKIRKQYDIDEKVNVPGLTIVAGIGIVVAALASVN